MTKKRIALLKIDNCLDCPNHVEFSDPGSDDSFDMLDTSVGCRLTAGQGRKDRWNERGVKVVSGSDRPFRHRQYCDVPEWCPLGTSQKTKTKASAKRLSAVQVSQG